MKNITNKIVLYNEKSHTKSSLQCEMREISVCLHVYWAFTHSYTLTLVHTLTHTYSTAHRTPPEGERCPPKHADSCPQLNHHMYTPTSLWGPVCLTQFTPDPPKPPLVFIARVFHLLLQLVTYTVRLVEPLVLIQGTPVLTINQVLWKHTITPLVATQSGL